MSAATILLLGPLRARIGTAEPMPSGAKLKSLLALLALRAGGQVQRDELIEELDLARTTSDAINALHAHVARLRRWFQLHGGRPDLVETVDSAYRLNVDRSAVDANRFVDLVRRAIELVPDTPSVAATMLEDALGIWRGDALLDVVDSPTVTEAADELNRWRSVARESLVDAWAAMGHDQHVVLNARQFIAADPLNESIRARHIVSLRRMRRHGEAIEAYRDAESVLDTELGIAPGPELRAAVRGGVLARRR